MRAVQTMYKIPVAYVQYHSAPKTRILKYKNKTFFCKMQLFFTKYFFFTCHTTRKLSNKYKNWKVL